MVEVATDDGVLILISYSTPVAAWILGVGVFIQREGQAGSGTTTRHINKWLLSHNHVGVSNWKGEPWWNETTAEEIQDVLDGKSILTEDLENSYKNTFVSEVLDIYENISSRI